MNKKIISLGPNCSVSITLRKMGLRNASYPWDWARYTELEDISKTIENEEGFRVEDWDKINNIPHYLPHDIPGDSHGAHENLYENSDTFEKYRRRFVRFFQDIKQDETYLIRFGDGTGLEKLQALLPNCKILHLPHGQEDSQETYDAITNFVGDNDHYSKIMLALTYLLNHPDVTYPVTPADIKDFVIRQNAQLNNTYLNKEIDTQKLDAVLDTEEHNWKGVDEVYAHVSKRVKELTNNDYALL